MACGTRALLERNAKHPLRSIQLQPQVPPKREPLMKAHQGGNDADVERRGRIPPSPDRKPWR